MAPSADLPETNYLDIIKGRLEGDTSLADLDAMMEEIGKDPDRRIAVFFHGGLVSKADGLETAQELFEAYSGPGANSYPVFFIWHSDLWNGFLARIPVLLEKRWVKLFRRLILEWLKGRYQIESIGPLLAPTFEPLTQGSSVEGTVERHALEDKAADQIRTALANQHREGWSDDDGRYLESLALQDDEFQAATSSLADAVRSRTLLGEHEGLLPDLVAAITPGDQRGGLGAMSVASVMVNALIACAARVLARFATRHDHGLPMTPVEEILRVLYVADGGEFAWGGMKRLTRMAFEPDPLCAGTAFLRRLAPVLNDRVQQNRPANITLLGHSAGAIYMASFFDALAGVALDDRVKFDVLLFAPAARYALAHEMTKRHAARIKGIRLFGMRDEVERHAAKNEVFKRVYQGSLLYFVSALCEGDLLGDAAILGMQRYQTLEAPPTDPDVLPTLSEIQRIKDQNPDDQGPNGPWVYSPTGAPTPDGFKSGAQHHGGFPLDSDTLESTRLALREGIKQPHTDNYRGPRLRYKSLCIDI